MLVNFVINIFIAKRHPFLEGVCGIRTDNPGDGCADVLFGLKQKIENTSKKYREISLSCQTQTKLGIADTHFSSEHGTNSRLQPAL